MAASMIVSLKKAPFTIERSPVRGLPSLGRTSSLKVQAGSGTKIKTDKPYGINGGLNLKDGVDASGRKQKEQRDWRYGRLLCWVCLLGELFSSITPVP
ncbi:photosystem II 10 kDa polypeptide, chloroplastic-like isoform X3 [Punica granatum]|uniref:Photosystem II 10 kDa polypeptide, chloroplastic n=1 Tax=Punica granatum TaxID=22663 RepID=A0A6P8EL67_PUNGR|nr:photosystem II 10 kDa polypeptide, chloroplastic-like isoform X3 [Punica granatum]